MPFFSIEAFFCKNPKIFTDINNKKIVLQLLCVEEHRINNFENYSNK